MIPKVELQEEYRKYSIAKMREALADAGVINESNPEPLAIALFNARITPFYYWQKRRMTELAKEKAKQLLIKKGEKEKERIEKKEVRAKKMHDNVVHMQNIKIVKKKKHEKVDNLKETK